MNLELLLAVLLTLAVETAFLALTYRRDAAFLALCAAANAATNLTLNLILVLLPGSAAAWAVYPLEAAVVVAEYAVYAYACGRSKKLFWLTLAANVLSYCLGLILFGHV